jgi:hypothetical protein
MLYNTGLLIIMSLTSSWEVPDTVPLALSTISIQDRPMYLNPLTLPHEALSLEEVSKEICRSVEYHLQGIHLGRG